MTAGRAGPAPRGRVAGLVVTLALAVGAAALAGYVFDGAGRPALGFWALTWGFGVGLFGLTVVAVMSRSGAARSIAGLLAASSAVVGGFLLMFTGPFKMPLTSLEGLWMYPATFALFAIAGAAGRRAVGDRPR